MALDPSMRASDADRERVATRLREGHAEGRLTIEEFQERLDAAYAAQTRADLVPITRDLPDTAPDAPVEPRGAADGQPSLRAMWAPWLTAVLVCTAVWLAIAVTGGGFQGFWPIWVALPWGAVLAARTITRPGPADRQLSKRPGRQEGERDHR